VPIEEEPLDSKHLGHQTDGIVEAPLRRQDLFDGPGGKPAVANVAAAGAGNAFGFSHRKGREIVMQHEGPQSPRRRGSPRAVRLARSQGEHAEHLGFAPGEKGAAVGARQDPHLAGDRPDFVDAPAVDAPVLL